MLGAVIYNGSNTLVVELPTGSTDLQTKLNSIGITQTADRILLSDEDGNQIRVKLYASAPEEAHLLLLLIPEKTLADANICMELLHRTGQHFQPRLKCGLLADRYASLEEFIDEATHGLFTDSGVAFSLSDVAQEVAESKSNVWTHIISLRREDAERLGYNSADAWMQLLRSQRNMIAENMKIAPENFRWYAAFHNEGHHDACIHAL